jgi:hypothetical protein
MCVNVRVCVQNNLCVDGSPLCIRGCVNAQTREFLSESTSFYSAVKDLCAKNERLARVRGYLGDVKLVLSKSEACKALCDALSAE